MSAPPVLAGRIPQDLRDAVDQAVAAGLWTDKSTIVRLGVAIALKLGEREAVAALARLEKGEELLAPGGTTSHRFGHDTERTAATRAARRAGAARLDVLTLAGSAGNRGVTADEVVRELGHKWAPNGLPRRVTDLVQAGALELKTYADEASAYPTILRRPVRRATRTGAPANVYVITSIGYAALAAGAAPRPPRNDREEAAA